jgi:hypothetical protein
VAHAAAGAHALHVAGANRRAVADGIAMRELAREHVADDFHVAVAVRAEALAGGDAILVDDAQRTELDVLRDRSNPRTRTSDTTSASRDRHSRALCCDGFPA